MKYKLALIYSSNLFDGISDKVVTNDFYETYSSVGIDVTTYYSGDFDSVEEFNRFISNYSSVQIVCHGDSSGNIYLDFLGKKKYSYAEFFSLGVIFDRQILIMNICFSGRIININDCNVKKPSIMIGYPNSLEYRRVSLEVLKRTHGDLNDFFNGFTDSNDFKLNEAIFNILWNDPLICNFTDNHHDNILSEYKRNNSEDFGFTFMTGRGDGEEYEKQFLISFRSY